MNNELKYRMIQCGIFSSKGKTLFNSIILVNISIDTNYAYADLVGNEQFDYLGLIEVIVICLMIVM